MSAVELTARLDRAEHSLNVVASSELESWKLSEQQRAAAVDAMATEGTLTIEGAEEKSSATAGTLASMVEMLDVATVDCEFVLLQTPEDLRALRLRGRAGFLRATFFADAPVDDGQTLVAMLQSVRLTPTNQSAAALYGPAFTAAGWSMSALKVSLQARPSSLVQHDA